MQMATPMHPSSVAEARELYMDMRERFQFEAVAVPAKTFLDQVKDRQPTQEQLEEFFAARRDIEAGQYPNLDSMGFGYRKPDEIEIQYLLIDNRVIEMVSVPEEDALSRWIAENADSLYKDVPVRTDPEEATEDDGDDAENREPETERKPLTEQEKRARAIEALRPGLVDQRVQVIETRLQEDLIDVEAPPLEKYPAVQEALSRPAGDLLDRKLNLAIYDVELKTALADITRQTGVQIAFPVGRFGDVNVDEDVLVSAPSANGGTLGEVLAELGRSVTLDLGPEAWHRFELLPGAVFPKTEQLDMLPVRFGTTGLIPLKQLGDDPMLATAGSGQRDLADVLAESEDLSDRVGREGPVMDVRTNGEMSRMVWRVAQYVPAKAPQELTPELRERVLADWRTLQAYELALEKARSQVTDAESMEAFAREHELEIERTGMLAKLPSTGAGYSAMMEFYRDVVGMENLFGTAGMDLQLERMWNILRQLAPENPAQGYSPAGDEAVVVAMPATRRVLLARRVDYDPAVRSNFENRVAAMVQQRYAGSRGFGGRRGTAGLRQRAQQSWLMLENIEQRVGYVRGEE
jgi:23S rRNA maturation mini-RNase III